MLTVCGSPAGATAEPPAAPAADSPADFPATPAEATASTVDIIMSAGTTQSFSDDAVPEEDVQTILQAGLAAESAINQQPWYFVAITDKDVMNELSGSTGMTVPPQGGSMPAPPQDGSMPVPPQGGSTPTPPQDGAPAAAPSGGAKASLGDSPLAIIIFMDEDTASPTPAFDCGLAAQNMYLAAVSLGYGAKIVSSPTMSLNGAEHDQICEKLGVDPSLTAVAVLLVGNPNSSGIDGVTGASVRAGLSEKTVVIG